MLKTMAGQETESKVLKALEQEPTHTALFDYAAHHNGDLDIQEGDLIVQIEELADGWAKGEFIYNGEIESDEVNVII